MGVWWASWNPECEKQMKSPPWLYPVCPFFNISFPFPVLKLQKTLRIFLALSPITVSNVFSLYLLLDFYHSLLKSLLSLLSFSFCPPFKMLPLSFVINLFVYLITVIVNTCARPGPVSPPRPTLWFANKVIEVSEGVEAGKG